MSPLFFMCTFYSKYLAMVWQPSLFPELVIASSNKDGFEDQPANEMEKTDMPLSRRYFLKKNAFLWAGVISGISGFPAIHRAAQKMYTACIIGRTGAGDYGHGMEMVFGGLENVTVLAVADENPQGRKEAAERSGAKRQYAEYREMLEREKPDLVSIGPRQPDCHRDMCLASIESGAHIYMEKPITEILAEADDIINAAEGKNIKIGVAHTRRFSREFISLKALLEKRNIGTVLEMRYYGKQDPRAGGEDLIVLGTHDMDMMRFFFGDPRWCFASVTEDGADITGKDTRRGLGEPYLVAGDTIRAQYAFNNNIQVYWSSIKTEDSWNESSRLKNDPVQGREKWGFDMFGTEGYLYYRSGFGIKVLNSPYLVPGDPNVIWQDIPQIPASELPSWKTHPIRNLIHAIETSTEPACSARDARWAIEMVMAVYWSQKSKGRVDLPLEERGHPL